MKIEAKSIEEYILSSGERESDLRELHDFIQKQAPDLKPVLTGGMTGKMLGYGLIDYKIKSSKEVSKWPIVALAVQKNYISLYIHAVENGKYIPELYADKLGKVSVGKSCIRFKKTENLNLVIAGEILQDINARYKRGEKLYGN